MSKQFFLWVILFFSLNCFGQKKIVIKFEHIANGKKIVLNDSTYTNAFGEKYTISKLKYYVSNISFMMNKIDSRSKNIFLIDQSKTDSISLQIKSSKIVGISFTIGVDSTLNCSGAQTGALDPLNDMFWTWNNGYVFFKLEGASSSSTADRNRIEQHIGGYKGEYKTMRTIFLPLKNVGNTITIQMDVDKYWNNNKIAENPVIAVPGKDAKKAADGFVGMFSVKG
jgi:hypothetical protein